MGGEHKTAGTSWILYDLQRFAGEGLAVVEASFQSKDLEDIFWVLASRHLMLHKDTRFPRT